MSCKVIGCHYNEDNTTERHFCETCKNNGYNKHECGTENVSIIDSMCCADLLYSIVTLIISYL